MLQYSSPQAAGREVYCILSFY